MVIESRHCALRVDLLFFGLSTLPWTSAARRKVQASMPSQAIQRSTRSCTAVSAQGSLTSEMLARRALGWALNTDLGTGPDLNGAGHDLDVATIENAQQLLSMQSIPDPAVERACQLLADLGASQPDPIGQVVRR